MRCRFDSCPFHHTVDYPPGWHDTSPMADEPDIRHFVHERYRQTDARLDQILNVIGEVQRQLDNINGRLDRIEHCLELRGAPTLRR
jgi:hypothetical protein